MRFLVEKTLQRSYCFTKDPQKPCSKFSFGIETSLLAVFKQVLCGQSLSLCHPNSHLHVGVERNKSYAIFPAITCMLNLVHLLYHESC